MPLKHSRTKSRILFPLMLCSLWQSGPLVAEEKAEARTALVIGVGEYSSTYFTRLEAPPQDATQMAAKLKGLGFDVTLKVDATRREMLDLTDAFGKTLAQKKGVGLFYFSGHGSIKPDEENPNYLIPAGSNPVSREDLPDEAFNAQRVANRMIDAGNRLNLIFLDACRNNALPGRTRDATGGLASMRGASGLMFFFATQPHQVALEDTATRRGLFTASLLKHMEAPNLSFLDMMGVVTAETETLSLEGGGTFKQSPFMSGTLSGKFAFVSAPKRAFTEEEMQRRIAEAEARVRAQLMPPPVASAVPSASPPASALMPSLPSTASSTPKAGDTMEIALPGGEKMTFCYCPAGSFMMGSPATEKDRSESEEQVPVRLSKGYWMAKTECTQGQWEAVMGGNPSHFKGGKNLPVEVVSWEDAQAFIVKLNGLVTLPEGHKLALPTEAQWEYACRAGSETAFAFGDTLTSTQANIKGAIPYGNSAKGANLDRTAKVGSYAANAWGLQDMHGNVSEWCLDALDWQSKHVGGTDPVGMSGLDRVGKSPFDRVVRGGSWILDGPSCRSASRYWGSTGDRVTGVGFRIVSVPAER